jgi:hypothetical protein
MAILAAVVVFWDQSLLNYAGESHNVGNNLSPDRVCFRALLKTATVLIGLTLSIAAANAANDEPPISSSFLQTTRDTVRQLKSSDQAPRRAGEALASAAVPRRRGAFTNCSKARSLPG